LTAAVESILKKHKVEDFSSYDYEKEPIIRLIFVIKN